MTGPARAHELVRLSDDLLAEMELLMGHGTLLDYLAAIETVVELINKSLYSLTISQDMLDEVDDLLNQPFRDLRPCAESIVPMFGTAYQALSRFQKVVRTWC